MTRETIDRIIDWFAKTDIPTVDLTGGAPEMIPDFKYFVERLKALTPAAPHHRSLQPDHSARAGLRGLCGFLARHQVEIIASMPCYSPENVNAQRGEGVFDGSINALQLLNSLGYGIDPELPLHLVYNPNGAFLPGPQSGTGSRLQTRAERAFRHRLQSALHHHQSADRALRFLFEKQRQARRIHGAADRAFNPATIDGLMCRNTINVGWRGEVYDCDFNQMLRCNGRNGRPLVLWDIDPAEVEHRQIANR